MQLPEEFEFSQSKLQDFVECPRRFWLKYIEERSWPAELTQPAREHEAHMLAGQAFHLLVQQHLNGIPEERLTPYVQSEELELWWQNYLAAEPLLAKGERYVEFSLAASLSGFRLVAKYDLVVANPDGEITIFDWKTNRKKPRRERLTLQMQTRVYPYLIVRAGSRLVEGDDVSPEQVSLRYWFAEEPDQSEVFAYSQDLYRRDEAYLKGQIEEVVGAQGVEDFPLTGIAKSCEPCVYRSYCDRGVNAPAWQDIEEDLDEDLSSLEFDPSAEIAY